MKRLHEFDALRGIAAVTVVFAHLLNYLPVLCFCLQLLAMRFAGSEQLTPFISPEWITRWNVDGWDGVRVIEFLTTRVFFLYSEVDTINVNLWTMPVEFAFSLLVFAVAALMLRRYDIALLLIFVSMACIASWRSDILEYFLKGLAGCVFFLGVVVAFKWDRVHAIVSHWSWVPPVLMICGLISSYVLYRHDLHYLVANALGMMSITLFFIGFASAKWIGRVLDHPFFAYLGEISFSLYLVHGSVLYCVFQLIAAQGKYGFGAFAIGTFMSLAGSFALAFLMARHVEMPLVRIVRRAIDHIIPDQQHCPNHDCKTV